MNRQPASLPSRLRIGFLSIALAANMLVGAFIGLLAAYEPPAAHAARPAQVHARLGAPSDAG